jgi:hypothetical protein
MLLPLSLLLPLFFVVILTLCVVEWGRTPAFAAAFLVVYLTNATHKTPHQNRPRPAATVEVQT